MKSSNLTRIGKTIILIILLVWILFPIYWMVSLATRSSAELTSSLNFIQKTFSLQHFVALFEEKGFGTAIINSLEVTLCSLALSLVFGLCCAYILARARFRFRMKGESSLEWVGFKNFLSKMVPEKTLLFYI